jgi:hypothetical protein
MKAMLYIGRRIQGQWDEKVVSAFLYNKKEYYWSGIKYVQIGARYEATDDFKMARNPKFVSGFEEILPEWIDKDKAAEECLRRKRESSRAKNLSDESWPSLRPLHLRAKKLSFFEKQRFAEYIARLIIQGKKK